MIDIKISDNIVKKYSNNAELFRAVTNNVYIDYNNKILYKVTNFSYNRMDAIIKATEILNSYNAPVLLPIDKEPIVTEIDNKGELTSIRYPYVRNFDNEIKEYNYVDRNNFEIILNLSRELGKSLAVFHNISNSIDNKQFFDIGIQPRYFYDDRKSSILLYSDKIDDFKKRNLLNKNEILSQEYENMISDIGLENLSVLHGDAHIGNIVEKDGNFLFVDLDSMNMGNSDFETGQMFLYLTKIFGKEVSLSGLETYSNIREIKNKDYFYLGMKVKEFFMTSWIGKYVDRDKKYLDEFNLRYNDLFSIKNNKTWNHV